MSAPWLVVLAGGVAAMQVGKLPPALPALHAELGLSLVQAGFLLSIVQLAGLSVAVFMGLWADVAGLKRTMLRGLWLLAFASALGGLAMMDWDKLRIFHAVADKGSLTHAGDVLHLSQSAVSRQIRALEESLNVTLFHRHARGLILTEQGELLYRTARDMAAKVNTAEALLRANQDKPAGRLKIHATVGFGSTWLMGDGPLRKLRTSCSSVGNGRLWDAEKPDFQSLIIG